MRFELYSLPFAAFFVIAKRRIYIYTCERTFFSLCAWILYIYIYTRPRVFPRPYTILEPHGVCTSDPGAASCARESCSRLFFLSSGARRAKERSWRGSRVCSIAAHALPPAKGTKILKSLWRDFSRNKFYHGVCVILSF